MKPRTCTSHHPRPSPPFTLRTLLESAFTVFRYLELSYLLVCIDLSDPLGYELPTDTDQSVLFKQHCSFLRGAQLAHHTQQARSDEQV